jgi:hypothetical protein
MQALRWPLLRILTVAAALAAGCSEPAPPKRGTINGKIMLDGKPAAKANIRFIALEGSGINVLAAVKDGVYEVPEGEGPVKGKYRVEFSVPGPDTWPEVPMETLPARYHRESKYLLDYDPDDPKPYNAALTSK